MAIQLYTEVGKKVGPKKEMVKRLDGELKLANESLKKKMDDLNAGKFMNKIIKYFLIIIKNLLLKIKHIN